MLFIIQLISTFLRQKEAHLSQLQPKEILKHLHPALQVLGNELWLKWILQEPMQVEH